MAFSYDPATSIGRVRLIISDTDIDNTENQIFTDAEISAFLDIEDDVVLLAAAQALDTIASDTAQVLKVIRLLDLETDGARTAQALHAHAQQLRGQVQSDDDFDYAEMVVDTFAYRERIKKQALRGAL